MEEYFYEKRIAMFSYGTAEIKLGSRTKTENLERRMRIQDALCALSVSRGGILPGSGVSLLKIANDLSLDNAATKIWQKALKKPFEQILKNAGLDYENILKQIKNEQYKVVYNILNNKLEDSNTTMVVDPFLVVKQSLINATSIAGMLLTTTSLIINEYKNELNKESEYNNW